jgi:hypothetical protein
MANASILAFLSVANIPAGTGYAPGDTFSVDVILNPGDHLAIGVVDTVDGSGIVQSFHLSNPGCAQYLVTTNPDGDSVTIITGANAGQDIINTWFTFTTGPCGGPSSGNTTRTFHQN